MTGVATVMGRKATTLGVAKRLARKVMTLGVSKRLARKVAAVRVAKRLAAKMRIAVMSYDHPRLRRRLTPLSCKGRERLQQARQHLQRSQTHDHLER